MISFDPDIAYEQNDSNVDEQSSLLKMDKPLLIFHELCQQVNSKPCTFWWMLNIFYFIRRLTLPAEHIMNVSVVDYLTIFIDQ